MLIRMAVIALLVLPAVRGLGQAPCCNVLSNGNFELGNTGFTSSLTLNCDANDCSETAYCVGDGFPVKCIAWPPFPDHTTGTGNYLIIDGNPSGPSNVWNNTVAVTSGADYCFCFWVASLYEEPFDLGMLVNGVNVATVTVSQADPAWTQYCLDWTAPGSGLVQISIRQLTGGLKRDFGIDDLEFGAALLPAFVFQPDIACGWNVAFFNQSTGPAPLTYLWNFGDPNSGPANTSALKNPAHKFTVCGTYEVCMTVSKGSCSEMICQTITVTDDESPVITCPPNVSLAATPPNCAEVVNGLNWLSAADNCGPPPVAYTVTGATSAAGQNSASGLTFQPGTSVVRYTATDKCENSGTCSFSVVISAIEICNGVDDDCDGLIDENQTACPPPTNLQVLAIGATSVTISWQSAACGDSLQRTCFIVDDSAVVYKYKSQTIFVLEGLLPGVTHTLQAMTVCDSSLTSIPSDPITFYIPCNFGCTGSLVPNASFDGTGANPLPNGPNQINLAPNWQQSVNGSNVNSVGDWYSQGPPFWLPTQFPGTFHDASNQYVPLPAYCGLWYGGFDLATCEGISSQLSATVALGTGYGVGFWWSPKEPVTANFSFLAILSNANCTVNTANSGTACTHQCTGDFHVVVPVTSSHLPGVWYFHSYSGNALQTFNRITFAANTSSPIVNNYIYVDEVCVRKLFQICTVGKPRISYNPEQPNAFFGEATLGAGSSVVSAVWDFGDGTRDSSCCLGSVIHDFAPGTYNVCLRVTATDTSGMTCSDSACIQVVITAAGDKCDDVAAFLQPSGLGDCCYDLGIINIAPNCFTQIQITLSSGDFVNSIFGTGWNIALNGSMVTLTPSAGGFVPVGQGVPVRICSPGGTGPYTVDVDFIYNGGVCHRSLNFSCDPGCCTDFNLFQALAAQVQTNEQFGDCTVSVNGTGLNDCMEIVWKWGDGMIAGPYADNTPLTHTYTTPGPHTVCYTIQEKDANGNVCWDFDKCLDLPVHCNDTCSCIGFSNLSFSLGAGIATLWQLPVDCENQPSLPLPCIANDAYYEFQGDFGCSNDCTSKVNYQFFSGSQVVLSGQATYVSGLHAFSIPSFKFTPGTYQLFLTGVCGVDDSCYCTINFTIPVCSSCCLDFNTFYQTVDNATTIALDPVNCKATLNIDPMPCQRIEWIDWGDGQQTNGPFTSGGMTMHTYAGSGTYIISYLAVEINPLTGQICFEKILKDTITLQCSACECTPVGPLTLTQNGIAYNIGCFHGPFTPILPCPVAPVSIAGTFGCVGANGAACPSTVTWTLVGPAGPVASGSTTTASILLTFTAAQIMAPGGYTLTLQTTCPGSSTPCVCISQWVQAACDPCCLNYDAFCQNMMNAFSVAVDHANCKAKVTVGPLAQCYDFEWVNWGDGNQTFGPLGAGGMAMHTYATGGTYIISTLAIAHNNQGQICFEKILRDTITLDCPSDSCKCGVLEWAQFYQEWSFESPIGCNNVPGLPVPCMKPGQNYFIHGNFTCMPDACGTNTVTWVLDRPGSLPNATGSTSTAPYPHFDISLPWNLFTQPGAYSLTITRLCGTKPCSCTFNFVVPPCPCPCDKLWSDVKEGFSVSGNKLSCKRKFKPVALCPGDMVTWSVNGPGLNQTYGPTTGNNPIAITFPSPGGVYNVCMVVTRIDPVTGQTCVRKRCQKVVVKCKFLPSDPDPHVTFCASNLVKNGDFIDGSVAGHMGQAGAVAEWNVFSNPGDGVVFVEDSTGASDDGHIVLYGGQNNFAGIWQQLAEVFPGPDSFLIVEYFTSNFTRENTPAGTQLEFRLQSEPIPGSPFQVIHTEPIDSSSGGWEGKSFSILTKPHPDKPYLIICLQSDDSAVRSVVGLDNIELCTSTRSGTGQPERLRRFRIFPNPNAGHFSVELPPSAPTGMTFRIVGLTGQLLREQPTQAGISLQTVQVDDLPPGLYFLQVVADGRVLAVEKFVKE